jgi:hypothetical protein
MNTELLKIIDIAENEKQEYFLEGANRKVNYFLNETINYIEVSENLKNNRLHFIDLSEVLETSYLDFFKIMSEIEEIKVLIDVINKSSSVLAFRTDNKVWRIVISDIGINYFILPTENARTLKLPRY